MTTTHPAITAHRNRAPRTIPTLLVQVQRADRVRTDVTPEPITRDLANRLLADGIVWVTVETGARRSSFHVGDLT